MEHYQEVMVVLLDSVMKISQKRQKRQKRNLVISETMHPIEKVSHQIRIHNFAELYAWHIMARHFWNLVKNNFRQICSQFKPEIEYFISRFCFTQLTTHA